MTKVCKDCKLDKSLSDFYPKDTNKDGLRSECKVCTNIKNKIRLQSKTIWNKVSEVDKTCGSCQTIKSYTEYYKCKTSTDGLRGECKDCVKSKLRFKNHKVSVDHKTCSKCGILKDKEEFHLSKISCDGLRPSCKQCNESVAKAHRIKNKEKASVQNKRYRDNNPHICSAISSRRRKLMTTGINNLYKDRLRELYYISAAISEDSLEYQVDHIIPLKHTQVCGLHVPWNMQILPKGDNLTKRNKFDGTYENESWRS